MKSADGSRCRDGDAEHQHRHEKKRSRERSMPKSNAIVTAQMPEPDRTARPQRKRQQRRQRRSRRGRPDGAETGREFLGDTREQSRPVDDGSTCAPAACTDPCRAAPGSPARMNRTPSRTTARPDAGRSAPAPLDGGSECGQVREPSSPARPKMNTNDASSTSTVIMSSTRSRMMVAKAPVALMFSWRDRKYGRMTSPARAGRIVLAAKPTAVARNELAKLGRPSGSSRYCQRHDADRQVHAAWSPETGRANRAGAPARSRWPRAGGRRCERTTPADRPPDTQND